MKSSLYSIVIGLLIAPLLLSTAHAASGDESVTPTQSEAPQIPTATVDTMESPLLVEDITAVDDMHILVTFNQAVIRESVRVRVTKQSDESNVRIGTFTGGTDNQTIEIVLTDTLEANTAYKMTVISAISESGIIIKDGADALKEFTTGIDLMQYAPIELNAPTNPNAVIVDAASTGATETNMLPKSETEEEISPSETATELPLTGMDTSIFLAIAGVLALIFILRRRQA